MKPALVLLFLIYVISTWAEQAVEIRDPTCVCPPKGSFKRLSHYITFCGKEMKEINQRHKEKVVQTTCEDNFIYHCPQLSAPSVIIEKCHEMCMHPPKEIFRNSKLKGQTVPPYLRMCVNQTQLGK